MNIHMQIYILFTLFLTVNSRLFEKNLFSRHLKNFLKSKTDENNKIFDNIIYNDLQKFLKSNNTIHPNISEIDMFLEKIDNQLFYIFEEIVYTIL